MAQDTARTFGNGLYEAVVVQEGVEADASGVVLAASTPTTPRVAVMVVSVAITIPLTVGSASTSMRRRPRRLGDRIPRLLCSVGALSGQGENGRRFYRVAFHPCVNAFGGVRPASTSATPWHAKRAMRVRVPIVALPMCGKRVILGAVSKRGFTLGSPSKTSRPAA